MNILIFSGNYPSQRASQKGVFLYNLVQEFVRQGHDVMVIAPEKYSFNRGIKEDYGTELAKVIRPVGFSFSNKKIGFIDTGKLTRYFTTRTARKAIKDLDFKPDVVYCHFLISALTYLRAVPNTKIPVYLASGESGGWIKNILSGWEDEFKETYLEKIKGIIAVSPHLKQEWMELGYPESNIILEPNGADLDRFKPQNKKELRRKHNLPLNKKILIFVGQFIKRKGVKLIEKALDAVDDEVRAVFLGKGPLQLSHPKIIYSGPVPNKEVAEYMAASDIFVMPTLSEGSSNVIVEAMASGLPIVSSDIPEIKAQCAPEFSILVNPKSVEEISKALNAVLQDDDRREKMGKAARKASRKFDISKRAERILKFIQEHE